MTHSHMTWMWQDWFTYICMYIHIHMYEWSYCLQYENTKLRIHTWHECGMTHSHTHKCVYTNIHKYVSMLSWVWVCDKTHPHMTWMWHDSSIAPVVMLLRTRYQGVMSLRGSHVSIRESYLYKSCLLYIRIHVYIRVCDICIYMYTHIRIYTHICIYDIRVIHVSNIRESYLGHYTCNAHALVHAHRADLQSPCL